MEQNCTHDCSTCGASCSSRNAPNASFREPANESSKIGHVIGVISGKGGVGKSMVTASLAVQTARMGFRTAILDADITGPSIPKAFGIRGAAYGNEDGILPAETDGGIKLISINLLLENAEEPVIWRGPVIAGVVKQFWKDVAWGEVDYMYVDMPPGTGDVPLTVFQSLPVDGIIVVTTPQDLVSMIVEKAIRMAEMMHVPVLGIVENMSGFKCPDCGAVHEIFGHSNLEAVAKAHGLEQTERLPLDPAIAKLCDEGAMECLPEEILKKTAERITKA